MFRCGLIWPFRHSFGVSRQVSRIPDTRASRACEQPADVPQAAVGVDVGLEKFATLSTGETIDNPRFFRADEHDLKRAQRRLSEQSKGVWSEPGGAGS